jgi:CheY-like chemotaxis protein
MLVDALMPGRNGYEVCQQVRADARLQNIPLLLMTGAFEPFDEEKARHCGADDVISKPFESQQLIEKVRSLVELGSQRGHAPAAEAPPFAQPLQEEPPVVAAITQPVAEPEIGSWADLAAEPLSDLFGDVLPAGEPLTPAELAPAAPEAAEFDLEVVEAAPEDDPWGVFDLAELPGEAVIPAEPTAEEVFGLTAEAEPTPVVELGDEAVFQLPPETDGEPVVELTAEALSLDGFTVEEPPVIVSGDEEPEFATPLEPAATFVPDDFAARWEPVEEENFTFQGAEPTPAGESFTVGMGEPLANLVEEPGRFAETDIEVEPPSQQAVFFEPAPAVAEPVIEPAAAAPPEAAPAAPASEEQLKAMVAQLTRDVIEKIVWEVVPDLAETLIREEIRKIRGGSREPGAGDS